MLEGAVAVFNNLGLQSGDVVLLLGELQNFRAEDVLEGYQEQIM